MKPHPSCLVGVPESITDTTVTFSGSLDIPGDWSSARVVGLVGNVRLDSVSLALAHGPTREILALTGDLAAATFVPVSSSPLGPRVAVTGTATIAAGLAAVGLSLLLERCS